MSTPNAAGPPGGTARAAEQLAAALPAAFARRTAQAFEQLLDPRVRWGGATDTQQTCHDRSQVLAFYGRLLEQDVSIDVLDVSVHGEQVRLQIRVVRTSPKAEASGTGERQIVLTVRDGLVVDIRAGHDDGNDDRERAPEAEQGRALMVELFYFDGCPNHARFLPHLRRLLHDAGIPAGVQLVKVTTDAQAQQLRFLGSPTLRINGRDVDPSADRRHGYGLQCRVYDAAAGYSGAPPDEWIERAVRGDRTG